MFRIFLPIKAKTFQNDLTGKFIKIEFHLGVSLGESLFERRSALKCCKLGKKLLQSRIAFCIPKQGEGHYKVGQVLQSEIFITKIGNYYKVGQCNLPGNVQLFHDSS